MGTRLQDWSTKDVAEWLRKVGLSQHIEVLCNRNRIDGPGLQFMSKRRLRRIFPKTFSRNGELTTLWNHIEQLRCASKNDPLDENTSDECEESAPDETTKHPKLPMNQQKPEEKLPMSKTAPHEPANLSSAAQNEGRTDTNLYIIKYPSKHVSEIADVYVTQFYSFDKIYFRNVEDESIYVQEIKPLLQDMLRSNRQFMNYRDMREGIACAVFHCSKWYRGTIIKKIAETVKLLLIDVGESVFVPVGDVAKRVAWLPKHVSLALPPMAYLCSYRPNDWLQPSGMTMYAVHLLASRKWTATFVDCGVPAKITMLVDKDSGREFADFFISISEADGNMLNAY
ncbi:unnamed protein product [Soboliphyme baturini]|uniref:SAM domain-containing protein n=1 Tax=Soboliphyme baturini TaxID=241478 RepID=A0A183ITB1_9BILA|nr:unnamed protein product [Soboliphyme baturini]